MLLIYDNLVREIQNHLAEREIEAKKIYYNIGKNWHKYRYIQICLHGITENVHYEYINGYWEIHFEDDEDSEEVFSHLRRMQKAIETTSSIGWHRTNVSNRGLLRREEIVNTTEEYLARFDELWDATNAILLQREKGQTIETLFEEPKDFVDVPEPLQEYHEPDAPNIISVGNLPFERFLIPSYQRPYKWSVKNVNQLISDILEFGSKNTQEYRLGTLVLHKHGLESNSPLSIVDGQQRSISLLLLLNELRKEPEFADLFKQDLCDSMDAFLSTQKFHESTSWLHIQENIDAIRYRIVEFSKKQVQFLLQDCKLVVISLYDISEAFQFFDSQNSRGKELKPHDLLKAFHLREIPTMTQVDKQNITDWESMKPSSLSDLFLTLFRIKCWIDGKNGREFTSQRVDTFKGPKSGKALLPYQKIYMMAECYTEAYNSDISRRLDNQHLEFPHQIDQITINGTLFFDMIRYYAEKEAEVDALLKKHAESIYSSLNTYKKRNRKGDQYTRSLFFAALLFYYDKFGEEGISIAIPKIFAWAYSMRIKQDTVQLATMDNYARSDSSFFRILHRAIRPSDIQNWIIEPIEVSDDDGMKEIIVLFKQFKYAK